VSGLQHGSAGHRGSARRVIRGTVRDVNRSLVSFVAELMREAFTTLTISNADARRVVVAGAVRVNGHVLTRPGARLAAADRVIISADPSRLARQRRAVTGGRIPILYRDDHVVAVDKPAGLPTHATADPARPSLVGELARELGMRPSALGVHQRLDAGTSGVVVFALTPEANRGLYRSFESRDVEKVYLALADARRRSELASGDAWSASGALVKTGTGRQGRRVGVDPAGQAAETEFTVRVRRGERLLVEARPRTGRQHQIRAHLAAGQLPILGDTRYGGPPAPRLHLHAWRLRFPHPVTGVWVDVEAEPPKGWLSQA
jgi:23S rRNA pseudouridine1911/1915/1917 synthase